MPSKKLSPPPPPASQPSSSQLALPNPTFTIHSRTLNRPNAFPSLSAFDLAFAAFPAMLRQKGTHPSPKSDLEQIQAAANGVLPLQYELWLAVAEVPYLSSSTSASTSTSNTPTPLQQTQSIIVGRISANVTAWSQDAGYVGFFEVDTAFPEFEQVGLELLKVAVNWLRGSAAAPQTVSLPNSAPTSTPTPATTLKGKKQPNPKDTKKTTSNPSTSIKGPASSQAAIYGPRQPVARIFGPVNFSTFFNYRLRTDDGFDSFGHWEPDNPAVYVEIFKKVMRGGFVEKRAPSNSLFLFFFSLFPPLYIPGRLCFRSTPFHMGLTSPPCYCRRRLGRPLGRILCPRLQIPSFPYRPTTL
jgi:hypothetical protein